ncbi:hypothetical protein ACIQU6_30695 [Streptomyces sp. NPDC090442]|uniref:hypothetical protein n=1 Tax=Streptomyces sp. NPDC090442 TaxID=3365962 RepID=UPI0038048287
MASDRALGEWVAELALSALRASGTVRVGDPTELVHRSGGLRLVVDVQPVAGPGRVTREEDAGASAGRRASTRRPRRRALPPASG